jgi:hypothetical protein
MQAAPYGSLRPTRAVGGLAWRFRDVPDAFAVLIRYRTGVPCRAGAAYRVAAVPADGAGSLPLDWRDGLVDRFPASGPRWRGRGALPLPRLVRGRGAGRAGSGAGALPPPLTLEEVVVMVRREGGAGQANAAGEPRATCETSHQVHRAAMTKPRPAAAAFCPRSSSGPSSRRSWPGNCSTSAPTASTVSTMTSGWTRSAACAARSR